jgi:hypothetical protein
VASPIFFFLIGFARTREVPWTWLAFGAVLQRRARPGPSRSTPEHPAEFRALRFAVLPLLERYVLPRPWLALAFAALCVPLIGPTDRYLEYGTEGWLWALFGLAHRMKAEDRAGRLDALPVGASPLPPTSTPRSSSSGSRPCNPGS